MSLKRIRHECEKLVEELVLPTPFSARGLCELVGAQRGRPIVVTAIPASAGRTGGMTVSSADLDVIYYQEHTSPLHQELIILHELAHLLRGHTDGAGAKAEFYQRLFPSLDWRKVQETLGRTTYANRQEQEAEYIASLILHRVSLARRPDRHVPSEGGGLGARLERALGHPPE